MSKGLAIIGVADALAADILAVSSTASSRGSICRACWFMAWELLNWVAARLANPLVRCPVREHGHPHGILLSIESR